MSGAPPCTGPPMDLEAQEALLEGLRASGADDDRIGAAAWTHLALLLALEHLHLAALHACRYEAFWNDELKLAILERMAELGMESHAVTLCHRWRLSEKCHKTKHQLFRRLFPKLPPYTDKKEHP